MTDVTEMPRKDVPPPLELVKGRIEEVLPPVAKALVDSGAVAVVDTREPDKFEAGHIDGAVNVPAGENGVESHSESFASRIGEATGGKPALLYCNSGNRSARATDALTNEHSVAEARSLVGGISLWNDLGYPVTGEVIADDEEDEEDES
ncbi:MAG: rhodanese-like domain-containing protein [Solirubrobacterales bacterium]|nr:rhodanese-like domain-containing protein [Solirubrobacterales bacterium]